MYVSVVERGRRAGPRPRPVRLRRPRGQRGARGPARRARRRADADRRARRQQPGGARDIIRDIRRALPPFRRRADRATGPGGSNEDGHRRPRRPADDPHRLHAGPRAAEQGRSSASFGKPTAATTCSTASSRCQQGFKKREAPRPVIVAITTEGPELSERITTISCSSPLRTPAPRSTSSRSVRRRTTSATMRGTATSCSTKGPARPAAPRARAAEHGAAES